VLLGVSPDVCGAGEFHGHVLDAFLAFTPSHHYTSS
jgi:hypothetical protein